MYETQKTAQYYGGKALGGAFRKEDSRKVLTTRNDGWIGFMFDAGKWNPY